jgi:tRNA-Thr(GGU) m(6)t(6)A37 methyltransferase TsaA
VITYEPIGVIRSPFHERAGMPLQSVAATDILGRVELDPAYAPGLRDLDGFSHLHLICHLDRSVANDLQVVPYLDDTVRGVFATRSPRHPNPIGLSVVRLRSVQGTTLHVSGIDLLDGTPVLDIKPYVPAFDVFDAERTGWLEQGARRVHEVKADR